MAWEKKTPLGTLTPVSQSIFSPVLRAIGPSGFGIPVPRQSGAADCLRFVLREQRVYFHARTESFSITLIVYASVD